MNCHDLSTAFVKAIILVHEKDLVLVAKRQIQYIKATLQYTT